MYHGTCVADKALGRVIGSAKEATLVSVVIGRFDFDKLTIALIYTALDISQHPERRGVSVVVATSLIEPSKHPGIDSALLDNLKRVIQGLFDLDVPVVVPSGNGAHNSTDVNSYPSLWAADNFPLIVVRACDYKGEESHFS